MRSLLPSVAFVAMTAVVGAANGPLLDGPEVVKLDWNTRSLQAADLDSDGRLDLAIVNNDRGRIDFLLQRSPGAAPKASDRRVALANRWEPVLEDARFTKDNYVTGITVHDLVMADLDGDKRPDLIYTGDPDALTVVRQKTDGTWDERLVLDVPTPSPVSGNLRVVDVNADGRPDIVMLGQKELCLLLQQSNGRFGRPERHLLTEENLFGLEFTDLNGDERADLAYFSATSREPLRVRFHGAVPGQFGPEMAFRTAPAQSTAQVLRAAAGAASQLAYIEQRTGQVSIVSLQNRDAATNQDRLGRPRVFAPRSAGRQGLSYAIADFNGDKLDDIVAADADSAQVLMYFRQPTGGFAADATFPSVADTRGVAAWDWDGDGRSELFVASSREQFAGVSSLGQDGRLTYPAPLPGRGRALAVAAGVLASGQPPSVLVLREDNGKRWIDFLQRRKEEAEIVRTLDLPAQRGEPKAMRLLDFNQDGRLDLAIFTPFDGLRLFTQANDGAWTDASAAPTFRRGLVENLDAGRVTMADVDGDGRAEVIVSAAGFARALRLNDEGALTVVDQLNARESGADVAAALQLPPRKAGDAPEFVLYERKSAEFQLLQRNEQQVFAFTGARPAGKIDPVAVQVARSPQGRPEIFLFGTDRFWWLPIDQPELEARKVGGYTSDLPNISYRDIYAADLTGDGQPELICNDAQRNLIEILIAEAEAGGWRSSLHFAVFDQDAHVQQRRGSPFEPREMIAADVTGDGRKDLVLLVHDRVLIYPQLAPPAETPTAKRKR